MNRVTRWLHKNNAEILIGFGITGLLYCSIDVGRCTPKALILLEEVKEETKDKDKKEKGKAIIKKVAPVYIRPALIAATSTACIISGVRMESKKTAAFATAYALSETALIEYKNKVIETIGEKKEQSIIDSIAKDKIDMNPISNTEVIIAGKEDTLFYDSISGRYFRCSIEKARRVENQINKRLLSEMYIGLNELYYDLGLPPTKQGNELGFNIDDGLIDMKFSAQIADDGTPCIVLGYHVGPRYGYSEYMYH